MPAVYPPKFLPAGFRGHYPHMARRDAALWARWLDAPALAFLGYAYDVALGGWRIEGLGLSEPDQLGWQYNTALKIDAVGVTLDNYWIIEVRPEATVSALGAALCYGLVADRDEVFDLPLRLAVLCETMQPDVEWACRKTGVAVWKLPPPVGASPP
jgi:hypothetical protein